MCSSMSGPPFDRVFTSRLTTGQTRGNRDRVESIHLPSQAAICQPAYTGIGDVAHRTPPTTLFVTRYRGKLTRPVQRRPGVECSGRTLWNERYSSIGYFLD